MLWCNLLKLSLLSLKMGITWNVGHAHTKFKGVTCIYGDTHEQQNDI